MGNLLRALSRLEGAGDCCSNANAGGRGAKDLFVDFEDARPAGDGEDSTVYDRAEEVLERAAGVLEALKQYKGKGDIRGPHLLVANCTSFFPMEFKLTAK